MVDEKTQSDFFNPRTLIVDVVSGAIALASLRLLLALKFPGIMYVGFRRIGIRESVSAGTLSQWIVAGGLLFAAWSVVRNRIMTASNGSTMLMPPSSILLPNIVTVAWYLGFGEYPTIPSLFLFIFTAALFAGWESCRFPDLISGIEKKSALMTVVMWLLCLSFVITFGILNVLQLHAGHMGYADSGFVAEALWNTLHGRFLYSNNFDHPMLLADHFSPVWLLMLPFYWLYPDHETLCVASAILLGSTIPIVYFLARSRTGSVAVAIAFAVAIYLNPAITLENSSFTYGFQAELFALPFLLAACFFLPESREMDRRSYGLLLVFLLLSLWAKENVSLPVTMVGVYVLWKTRLARLGVPIIGLGLIWGYTTTEILLPAMKGGADFYQFERFYGHLGRSIPEVLVYLARHPSVLVDRLLDGHTWQFIILLLLPFCLMALARLDILLIGSATMFFLTIGRLESMRCIKFHYKLTLLPFVIYAAVMGFNKIQSSLENRSAANPARIRQGLLVTLLAAAVSCGYLFGAGPMTRQFRLNHFVVMPRARFVLNAKEIIPQDAVLFASTRLAGGFTNRPNMYLIGLPATAEPEVILVDTYYPWGSVETNQEFFHRYMNDDSFELVAQRNYIYLLAKREIAAELRTRIQGDPL